MTLQQPAGPQHGVVTRTQTWDVDNRVTQMTRSDGMTATFIYDGDGKRVKRVENGITTTVFIGGIFEQDLIAVNGVRRYYNLGGKRFATGNATGVKVVLLDARPADFGDDFASFVGAEALVGSVFELAYRVPFSRAVATMGVM